MSSRIKIKTHIYHVYWLSIQSDRSYTWNKAHLHVTLTQNIKLVGPRLYEYLANASCLLWGWRPFWIWSILFSTWSPMSILRGHFAKFQNTWIKTRVNRAYKRKPFRIHYKCDQCCFQTLTLKALKYFSINHGHHGFWRLKWIPELHGLTHKAGLYGETICQVAEKLAED